MSVNPSFVLKFSALHVFLRPVVHGIPCRFPAPYRDTGAGILARAHMCPLELGTVRYGSSNLGRVSG